MLSVINSDKNFLDTILTLKESLSSKYALHFNCSALDQQAQSNSKIKVHSLVDYFRDKEGYLFVSSDKDIIVIFNDQSNSFVKDCRYEIINKFFDTELLKGGKIDVAALIRSYVLAIQWEEFFLLCKNKI